MFYNMSYNFFFEIKKMKMIFYDFYSEHKQNLDLTTILELFIDHSCISVIEKIIGDLTK